MIDDVDAVTLSWIRDESDRLAVKNGCRFSERRARHAVDWIEANCYLQQGVPRGTRITLGDWQLDFVMRLFGWVRPLDPTEPHFNKPEGRTHVRRFRKASVWVPKKNAKTATAAAISLYLLIGDQEPGQNVYIAAKDGKQALLIQDTAMNMCRTNPKLKPPVCNLNASTKKIYYGATMSAQSVVAGDNKDSQEGLNGSVIIDEVHVVPDALMKILKGAGISRAEPLQIEVSTAGNDPDGYGKAQFDKALRVRDGLEEDQSFLAIVYAAPQALKDTDLEADPLKYIAMANPSLGRIVNPREVLDDYHTSKRRLNSLLDFKMYRLNIWQNASNPWIRVGDWAACVEDFTEDFARGLRGPVGFDFARIHDMTAAVICLPSGTKKVKRKDNATGLEVEAEEAVCRILCRFWMAEESARAHPEMPFLEWAEAGHIILTPGNMIDAGYVVTDFLNWIDRLGFTPTEIAGDPSFGADVIMQMIADGVTDSNGNVIRQGCRAPRVEFQQNWATMTEPTELFEGAIMDQVLRHNNNPVMTWQIGHCELRKSRDGELKMPQKPDGKKEGLRKIDGILAALMSYARFKKTPPPSGLEIWSMG